MDKVTLLCDMQRYMLTEFSRRTTEVLRHQMLCRITLGPLQKFLALKVSKEIEKDRNVIQHAASLVHAGTFPTQQDIQHLISMSRAIDQAFIQQSVLVPLKLSMQYPLLEPIRRQRIQSLLGETHHLLRHWQLSSGLRRALAQQYNSPQFAKLLYDLLHLYSLETRLLAHAVRLPGLIRLMRESLNQTVYVAMQGVARNLAQELADRLLPRHQ